jgi:hypothetical protein
VGLKINLKRFSLPPDVRKSNFVMIGSVVLALLGRMQRILGNSVAFGSFC